MTTRKRIFLIILIVIVSAVAIAAIASRVSNPWNAKHLGELPPPIGFRRVEATEGSYGAFLRDLPLKKRGSIVKLYTGGNANLQLLSAAVVDISVLSNDEQCADMTMRLRAEYLWSQGRYGDICFTSLDGKANPYTGGDSRKALESYLRRMYGICNTTSVFLETKERPLEEIQPGDVLVYKTRKKGHYGHAILVADVAKRSDGKIAVLCVEGNTPAREAHVVRNPNPLRNPWFILSGDEGYQVSFFHFHRNELRHY